MNGTLKMARAMKVDQKLQIRPPITEEYLQNKGRSAEYNQKHTEKIRSILCIISHTF